jgi:SAM-dependent methyltransferase
MTIPDNPTQESLLAWLASLPPWERDAAADEYLGISGPKPPSTPPGKNLIGYHASGVAPIVRALMEVPVVADDVFVDLGSGLGKVAVLARILTGATALGIELQPALVESARRAAARRGVDVRFIQGDAREVDLSDGTVFFLYLPFTGSILTDVMLRLRAVASCRAITVCALGVELERYARWLTRRSVDSFWLTVYDGALPGIPRRPTRDWSPALARLADIVAFERKAESLTPTQP